MQPYIIAWGILGFIAAASGMIWLESGYSWREQAKADQASYELKQLLRDDELDPDGHDMRAGPMEQHRATIIKINRKARLNALHDAMSVLFWVAIAGALINTSVYTANTLNQIRCQNQAFKAGIDWTWSPTSGCFVQVAGRWYPIEQGLQHMDARTAP